MTYEHTYAMVQKHIYELYTSRELLLLIFYISQGSVVTHLRCSGENDTSLVANLLLSPTVKEFLKLANSSQSYERISSGPRCTSSLLSYYCGRLSRLDY